ncbi:MAG: dihydroneopterin aldolase [Verrucomicrobiota bacterium]
MTAGCIRIHELELPTYIGVPEEERATQQVVRASVNLFPRGGLEGLGDEMERSLDYYVVAQRLKALAAQRERKLIETLAEDLVEGLWAEFSLRRVEVELRKYILPDASYVSVSLVREN